MYDAPENAASAAAPHTVVLNGRLTLDEACAIADGRAGVAIGPSAAARMRAARGRLLRAIEERRLVYGVTTGFGPLANRITPPEALQTLQQNLIYHLASGVGPLLKWREARATALARLVSIACGWSGASRTAVDLLAALLNSPFAPAIPSKGTVGASGDLTPLSHLALALMGEGGFIDASGQPVADQHVFAALGRAPLTLEERDGLALVNGVSAMTGVAVLNADQAARLWRLSVTLTVGHAELLRGRIEAWRPEFAQARPHPGQIDATKALLAASDGSSRLIRGDAAARRLPVDAELALEAVALQDPYSIRCAPQILGAVRDQFWTHEETVERELNAASDNPIFVEAEPGALHGGNFMGAHVALASDALINAVIVLAGHAERRIARLTDEKKNGGLPAFLHAGPSGLNSGFMGAQVTASALLAEMRARGGAASQHSIPTNGDNQDVVSMGTIAARGAADALDAAADILAIEALCVAQGVDLVGRDGFSASTLALHEQVRARSPKLDQDRPLSADIAAVKAALCEAES